MDSQYPCTAIINVHATLAATRVLGGRELDSHPNALLMESTGVPQQIDGLRADHSFVFVGVTT